MKYLIICIALWTSACKKEEQLNPAASIIFTARSASIDSNYRYTYKFLGNEVNSEKDGVTTTTRNQGTAYSNQDFTLNTNYYLPFTTQDSILKPY